MIRFLNPVLIGICNNKNIKHCIVEAKELFACIYFGITRIETVFLIFLPKPQMLRLIE